MATSTTFLRLFVLASLTTACATEAGVMPVDDPMRDDPDAPTFLAFGASKTALVGHADTVTITAALTDPDGIDDLVGGTLQFTDTGALIGAFATSSAEGAYSLTLDVPSVLAGRTVVRDWTTTMIPLTAEFFDQAGHKVARTVDLTFACPGDQIYIDDKCILPFEAHPVEELDQCVALVTEANLAVTCDETCARIDSVCGDSDCTSDLANGDVCLCGECTPPPPP